MTKKRAELMHHTHYTHRNNVVAYFIPFGNITSLTNANPYNIDFIYVIL